eukprot:TRINITY_DN51367_c0_g1_i1.p1 TRINITY_DN51367_c0_g1~~TRINITY_DN51367_c0_g1_i1.p1  ORF type:complete len:422 (-),score=87.92 TRINITY_DN51367_c0_g1_i1:106-1371(-)
MASGTDAASLHQISSLAASFAVPLDGDMPLRGEACLPWTVEVRPPMGRCLVAARDLSAGTLVFSERPVVKASVRSVDSTSKQWKEGPAQAAAIAILRTMRNETTPVPEIEALRLLQVPDLQEEGAAAFQAAVRNLWQQLQPGGAVAEEGLNPPKEDVEWALGVASVNAHSTNVGSEGGAAVGLLASMMPHSCCPSAYLQILDDLEGSPMRLRCVHDVLAGEVLSVSYVVVYEPTHVRQSQLLAQHGFECTCCRCSVDPELVRAFVCPACGDGPCSPAHPLGSCRQLKCEECEELMELDELGWAELEKAEACPVVCQECVSVLHPFHHKLHNMYRRNISMLPVEALAQWLLQAADAFIRLSGQPNHPTVARDLEAAARAFAGSGDLQEARKQQAAAQECYTSFFGAAAIETKRVGKVFYLGA